MKTYLPWVILALLALPTGVRVTYAQHAPPDTASVLFGSEAVLDLTLAMDLRAVTRDKSDDPPYCPAQLWHLDTAGDTISFDLGVRTRGKFRLNALNCRVPPLQLNFKKKETPNTVFAGQDKIKLVTHCKNIYEPFILQEYLAYKIYNLLTEKSFRVRLVRITYEDTQGKTDPITKYAFFIEHEDHLAERNGAQVVEQVKFHQQQTDPALNTLMAVFQYYIGNTDWVTSHGQNIKFIYIEGTARPIAVPYDFDLAGFINAPYAVPNPALNLKSVQERRFMGVCRTEQAFVAVFDVFVQQKAAIYALFRNLTPLDKKYVDRSLTYFDVFYQAINNPKTVKHAFLGTCL